MLNSMNLQRLLNLKNGDNLPKPNSNSKLGGAIIVGIFILLMCLFMYINNSRLKQTQQDLQADAAINNSYAHLVESIPQSVPSDRIATDQGYAVMSKMILPSDSYRTVEYYKLHKGERKLKLEECAKYVQTNIGYENCKNAKAS